MDDVVSAALFDDAKRAVAGRVDWADPREAVAFWLTEVVWDSTPLGRTRVIVTTLSRAVQATKEQFTSPREVGAAMIRRFGLPSVVQEALYQVCSSNLHSRPLAAGVIVSRESPDAPGGNRRAAKGV